MYFASNRDLGKFITAYGWTEATVNRVLSVLATKFGFPVPTVSPVLPPSLDRLSLNEELQPWVDLMREMHLVSLRKVEKERAEGVDISQDILDAYPFIKAPATIQSITEKESLLGVELPQDYKAFLQVTNGTGFSGVDSIPNLLPIEELEWQDATECGLGELRVDVLPPTISSQSSSITLSSEEFFDAPILEKVLLISDLDEETLIFLLDPAYVWKVWTWVADRRNLPHGGGQTQWL
ncbi:hypothetical protein F5884DRAFT_756274 [Xylogone sp. PMI_703]|nr:hypothetical protein F5884DRAFT_756274 [Xylogone sp. PMI_703]